MTNKKILLAEDDKFLATAMGDKLEREGFIVIKSANGLEAVEMVKKERPDLLLLDLIMPQKTGFEALAEIKADPKFKSLPVIVLSNLSQETDIAKAKSLGAIDYFVKSDVQMREVVERVKELLA